MNRNPASVTTPALIARLLAAEAYPHPVQDPTCVETHISWVLLTGAYAYKIKKPVSLGFLDFSTLPLRHAACLEELRLNKRLAPQLYVDVVPIVGPVERAKVLGTGEPVEYAVRMHEFAQANQLDRLLEAGRLSEDDIDRAAQRVARFHSETACVDLDSEYGTSAAIRHPVEEVLGTLRTLLTSAPQLAALEMLASWTRSRYNTLESTFAARRREGFVRECHGDLHLGNLARIGEDVVPFDCIEFSAELRWIDVICDIAFLMMDLLFRDRGGLAFRLIDGYLQARGDFAGMAVLRYYLVYRALVRSMVALLRRKQLTGQGKAEATAAGDAEAHLLLAQQLASPRPPVLFLMHGLSGSGKTRVSGHLMERWPALRARSDVERKRLLGLAADQTTGSAIGAGAYSEDLNEATYQRLLEAAATSMDAGFSMIVDAANLRHAQRERFRALAAAHGVRMLIVSCAAPEEELRRRLRERSALGTDASEANESVLDEQLLRAEPLDAAELAEAVVAGPDAVDNAEAFLARVTAQLHQA